MDYVSTRSNYTLAASSHVMKIGIAPDGGLFVPEKVAPVSLEQIKSFAGMGFQQRAAQILKSYLDDYSLSELDECVKHAYSASKFSNPAIAPVKKVKSDLYFLELWHGPTSAFKDMALQLLPLLLVKAIVKTNEVKKVAILVATSGDTGKAALEGFKDVDGTEIIVVFPNDGISEVQKLQMITQQGNNVHVIAVKGNFDDAQNAIKAIFTDAQFAEQVNANGYVLSSANSINWGRLVPQITYYFSAYADILKSGDIRLGEKVNFVVPSGNFGNILAAFYAYKMGLPIHKLICASNENKVLTDFVNTGLYDLRRDFKVTISPAMDILISSNLERFLFEVNGHNSQLICKWMSELKSQKFYSVDSDTQAKMSKILYAGFAAEGEVLDSIRETYSKYKYVIDTHTGVGVNVYDKYVKATNDTTKTIIVSTASPFKFNKAVSGAILGADSVKSKDEFELLKILSQECDLVIPEGLKDLDKMPIRHKTICEKEQIKNEISKILLAR